MCMCMYLVQYVCVSVCVLGVATGRLRKIYWIDYNLTIIQKHLII